MHFCFPLQLLFFNLFYFIFVFANFRLILRRTVYFEFTPVNVRLSRLSSHFYVVLRPRRAKVECHNCADFSLIMASVPIERVLSLRIGEMEGEQPARTCHFFLIDGLIIIIIKRKIPKRLKPNLISSSRWRCFIYFCFPRHSSIASLHSKLTLNGPIKVDLVLVYLYLQIC